MAGVDAWSSTNVDHCEGGATSLLKRQKRPLIRRVLVGGVVTSIVIVLLMMAVLFGAPVNTTSEVSSSGSFPARWVHSSAARGAIQIYLGNGCFWERQWAYFEVETDKAGPFGRAPRNFTSKLGYAGGTTVRNEVCYHTGDARDYSRLGHAEAVRVTLDADKAHEQMSALAKDFFGSFKGASGSRGRPDPMDRGAPYRSFVGLPGGLNSKLYTTFAAANAYGMALVEGVGGDGDVANTVWIYDSARFPFYDGEVYHQHHCNFFSSDGMPCKLR